MCLNKTKERSCLDIVGDPNCKFHRIIFPSVKLLVISLFWAVSVTAIVSPCSALAQHEPKDSIKDQLLQINTELSEIRKELGEIKTSLSIVGRDSANAPTIVADVSIDDDPFLGEKGAPITVIEFSDYQCPFCARFAAETFPNLKKEYVDSGKVKYVFRDFPLPFHQYAQKAAEAASCAGEQGKYWEMHDKLFQNQAALQVADLEVAAKELPVDMNTFISCLDHGTYESEIGKDIQDGSKAGVKGTPSFFVGLTNSGKSIKGVLIVGAQPLDIFKLKIEELLKEKSEFSNLVEGKRQ